jgi:hypothetical protein
MDRTGPMDFSAALLLLRRGYGVRRDWWPPGVMVVALGSSSLRIRSPSVGEEPYRPEGAELLARDWMVVR